MMVPQAHVGELWRRRAKNELTTSRVFELLHAELQELPAPPQVLALCRAAVDDERAHADWCQRLAEHYGASPEPPSVLIEPRSPRFPVCSPRVHRSLFAALHCSVNETLAVTYLSACLAEAQSPVVRDVLKRILKDEVRHSRIGWAVLASPALDPADRRSVAGFMPALLQACVEAWFADTDDWLPDVPRGYGFITRTELTAATRAAIHDIILPGLDHLQIASAPARQWAASCAELMGTAPQPHD